MKILYTSTGYLSHFSSQWTHLRLTCDTVFSFNRGSAIAKIVGNNAVAQPEKFNPEVSMWVFEEVVDGEKLTNIINTRHENVKYLPGIALPEKVVSTKYV